MKVVGYACMAKWPDGRAEWSGPRTSIASLTEWAGSLAGRPDLYPWPLIPESPEQLAACARLGLRPVHWHGWPEVSCE